MLISGFDLKYKIGILLFFHEICEDQDINEPYDVVDLLK